MKNNLVSRLILSILITFLFFGNVYANDFGQAVAQAMQTLKTSKGDKNLLVMTNAPYVAIDGRIALSYLDQAQEATGCTVGKGNLLFFQRPQDHPLRLMLFKKQTGAAVIIEKKNGAWSGDALNLSAETISDPAFWENAKTNPAGKDLFTLAAIANVWAKDAPYDFLKSAELHNHICPGLTSGYLAAHYVLKKYPLKKEERYTLIACPVWCKEDAFQVVLDCTPGKKSLIAKQLSKQQRDNINIANPAGMVLIWDAKEKTGKGVALSFDFDRLRALTAKQTPKAATVLAAIDHLREPERFVAAAAEFTLDQSLFDAITQAGSNPYEIAGLTKK